MTLLVGVTFSVIAAEVVLRLSGRTPWVYVTKDAREPTMHEFEPRLGWKAMEGSFVVPAYSPSGSDIRLTFDERGRRRTRAGESETGNEMVVVGGSFTQGWAISDEETFAWKLQERFPELNVLNYGTSAYGTYQSLLVLESELSLLKSPVVVVYGFILDHGFRNVGAAGWLMGLSRYSRRGIVSVPYATLEDGALVRHPPESYLALPFRRWSATVAFMEEVYMKKRVGNRAARGVRVTEELLAEMAATSERFGARFLAVQLDARKAAKNLLSRIAEARDIEYVECGFSYEGRIVPGEGHPNGEMNTRWAECVSEALREEG